MSSSHTPATRKVNSPRLTTARLSTQFEFTLIDGLWCSWCGEDIRACDAEPLDDDGGMRLVCRDCGHLLLQWELRL
jgi:hypothetical protein